MERPPRDDAAGEPQEASSPAPRGSSFRELIRFAVVAALIILPVRLFIAQPFIVSGASMDPTFRTGEYLVVDELSYRFREPKRGDVIVFRLPIDPRKFLIKRVIGLPGERVAIEGNTVRIENGEHPEGITLTEPYLGNRRTDYTLAVTLRDGEYFVMGDNRAQSLDSRIWGALPGKNIVGRALVRLLPPQRLDVFPGYYLFEDGAATPR